MKMQTRNRMQNILVLSGIVLLAGAAVLLLFWQVGIHTAERRAETYVHAIRTLIPEPQGAVPEERRDNTMPVLSVKGTDFIGILEMPRHGSALPVCADWGKPHRYPCRFDGSVYNTTLQIGGTSQKGQFDFFREISVGDSVYFTDMEGNRYGFTVADLLYSEHTDQAALHARDAALTLFIKNIYAFEYVIVFCDIPGGG